MSRRHSINIYFCDQPHLLAKNKTISIIYLSQINRTFLCLGVDEVLKIALVHFHFDLCSVFFISTTHSKFTS